jgi:hypothetical protein
VSALSISEAETWLGDAGFDGYIEKPIDVLELPRQVRSYCVPR